MTNKSSSLFLCGLMGVGKTTIGHELALKEGRDFIDLDKAIEQKYQRSIKNIFSTNGEDKFRQLETTVLKEVLQKKENSIVSLGGGTLITEKNRDLLRNENLLYLKASPAFIAKRLGDDQDRPLLEGFSDTQEVERKLRELLVIREKYYNLSSWEICVENKSIDNLVNEIRSWMQNESS